LLLMFRAPMPLSQAKVVKTLAFERIFYPHPLQGAAQYASWITKGD
jgi:hypothetical protein